MKEKQEHDSYLENCDEHDPQLENHGFDWEKTWSNLLWEGFGERFLWVGSALVSVLLGGVALWTVGNFYLSSSYREEQTNTADEPIQVSVQAVLPYFDPNLPNNEIKVFREGLFRFSQNHTDLPAKPRTEVTKYEVQPNDTIIGIAEKFNLDPSTILWGNPYTLSDDPHALKAGQELNILPIDGVYYEWHDGDGLNGVSQVYQISPEDIINYPGNALTLSTVGDFANPNIPSGKWLIIPGGKREFVQWSAPFITRENPAVASIYGPGACSAVMDGPLGSGTFVWPTSSRWISGYDYNEASNHRALDVGGRTGDAIYAADAGVVVYAGWNNWGYGNVVMVDHGNGWQTLYAHLDSYNVQCGYYVQKGDVIGGMGTTGNSSGTHLHYEMRYNGVPQNPNNFY